MPGDWCADCGTKYSDGCCPNCHEALLIERTQAGEDPWPRSEEWRDAVEQQEREVRGGE